MSTRVVDQVDTWDEGSFSGGYRELHDLADRDFSGVVRAGGAELYMTRGVAVGIRMGAIEDFESAGTTYEAPADALPLLAIMQERNDEVRAKYYTEKTSISKVDKTLSDGGFTGFIELSENVLSGDYYIVYQAGKSMSIAYVGESSRLVSGDEAFETADGEVGIYKVWPAEIDAIEIPEPEDESGDESDSAAGGASVTTSETAGGDEPTGADGPTGTEQSTGTATAEDATGDTGTASPTPTAETRTEEIETTEPDTAESGEQATERGRTDRDDADQPARERQRDRGPAPTSDGTGTPETQQERGGTAPQPGTGRTETDRKPREQPTNQPTESTGRDSPARKSGRDRSQSRQGQGTPASGDLETRSIPSLDPDYTEIPDRPGSSGGEGPRTGTGPSQGLGTDPTHGSERTPQEGRGRGTAGNQYEGGEPRGQESPEPDRSEPEPTEPQLGNGTAEPDDRVDTERIETLEAKVERKETEIDRLESELESATNERADLEETVERLETERDDLASEVERLESELQHLEEELGAATDAERRITASEALAGTDIFVRYRSKGKATLEKAHGSSTRREEVNDNLRLEKHTQFDADAVAVGGQSYQEFLESTLEYQFVRWVVRELLFEIRETGHEKELIDLYDVLPQIDRAELSGVIDVIYREDGQETQSQESFDVVLRNRMGHPLLAANLNDTREATTEGMMEQLITAAERVGQSSDSFSGAFLVTESFFDPGALEVASSATQGGLLSRDKRKSFVNLSRKTGYHLCLVEARNENFHLAVPEL